MPQSAVVSNAQSLGELYAFYQQKSSERLLAQAARLEAELALVRALLKEREA